MRRAVAFVVTAAAVACHAAPLTSDPTTKAAAPASLAVLLWLPGAASAFLLVTLALCSLRRRRPRTPVNQESDEDPADLEQSLMSADHLRSAPGLRRRGTGDGNASPASLDRASPAPGRRRPSSRRFRQRAGTDNMWQIGTPSWQPAITIAFSNVTYDVVIGSKAKWWCQRVFGCRRQSVRDPEADTVPLRAEDPTADQQPPGQPATGVREQRILHGISGVFKPGQLVALMGPSGAGKSSLLDIIARRNKSGTVRGDVQFVNPTVTIPHSRDVTGYVLQDDVFLPTETVRETLLFAARMRSAPQLSEQEVQAKVDCTLEDLDITRIANSRIGHPDSGGGISGGERKRVSIGVELVSSSRVLVLDEPTSGLDSRSTEIVMNVLRKAADSGCIVVCSIHQPTTKIFRSFDRVLLLARGGYQLYLGPPDAALRHFRSVAGLKLVDKWANPAEILLEVCTRGTPSDFAQMQEAYLASEMGAAMTRFVPFSRNPAANTSEQGASSSASVYRDPSLLFAQLLVTCMVGALSVGIFWKLSFNLEGVHNRTGFLFFVVIFFSLVSTSSLSSLYSDKVVFFRERAAGTYTTLPYFAAKMVCDLIPLRVVPPILFGFIVHEAIGLNPHFERYVIFFVALVLINVVATILCYLISVITTSQPQANLVASLIFVFNTLFGGFLLTGRYKVIDIIMYFSIFNFGWKVLMVNEFKGMCWVFTPGGGGGGGGGSDAGGGFHACTTHQGQTGATWLENFDIHVLENPHIVKYGLMVLAVYSAGMLVATYITLAYIRRYVK